MTDDHWRRSTFANVPPPLLNTIRNGVNGVTDREQIRQEVDGSVSGVDWKGGKHERKDVVVAAPWPSSKNHLTAETFGQQGLCSLARYRVVAQSTNPRCVWCGWMVR